MHRQSLLLVLAFLAAPLTLAHTPAGPKDFCESISDWAEHDYVVGGSFLTVGGDGNLSGDCNADGLPADYDGHIEWGVSGVWLKAALPVTPCADADETPHHPVGGPFRVVDDFVPSGVPFDVTADNVDLTGTDPCGDDVADESAACIDYCVVSFAPGLDGYYVVFLGGSGAAASTDKALAGVAVAGHVYCGDD